MKRGDYSRIRLQTPGQAAWSFYGRIVVESCAGDHYPWATHGHDITIYELSDGGYAVLVKFWSYSQDEPVSFSVQRLAMHSLNWFLLNYNAGLDGHSIKKSVKLSRCDRQELQSQFDEQVTDILSQLNTQDWTHVSI
jgi:hypothetical protein